MNYQQLADLVKSELIPSLGCTEPVAVGLAVSNTCVHLENEPTHIHLKVSSNIFKNAYFVTIPGTQENGIPLAATLGYLLKKENNTMEIFADVTPELIKKAHNYLEKDFISLEFIKESHLLIEVTATNESEKAYSITYDSHDKMVHLEKDGKILINVKTELKDKKSSDIMSLNVADLISAAENIDINELAFLEEPIKMNKAASDEGLTNDYGMKIGKTFKKMMDKNVVPNDLFYQVKMRVAAAVDMRMGGGPRTAMTMLGSGNQGFEASLPIVTTCEFLNLGKEKMLRALFISYLVSIRMKYAVGILSPICSALFTGAGASAGITWLLGGNQQEIEGAMQNIFSNLSGIMCDGAKDSCASKLCTCAGEAVLAAHLSMHGSTPTEMDGIISAAVENTIENIARVSHESMKDIDINLIDIMVNKA